MNRYWMVLAAASLLLLTVGWLWMGARQATRRVAAFGDELWRGSRSSEAAAPAAFFESHLAEQPEVVQRYFRWSLRDGTPPARAARLELTGRIRLGRGRPWMPHRSEETIRVGDGFVWTARVAGQFPITGADIYVEGRGEMAWRLAGLLPVMRAADPDITRSARWRFVAEHFFLPGALLPGDRVLWTPLAPHRARISIEEDGIVHLMTVDFHPEGMPCQISLLRWGDFETEGGNWREIPYAVRCEGVFRNGGYSLPHQYTASWWAGTDRELSVVELEIVKAEFR